MTKQEWEQVVVFCRTMGMLIDYVETKRIPPGIAAHDSFGQWAKDIVPALQYLREEAEIRAGMES